MAAHEAAGKTDEWYTPKYVFDALAVRFDMDVASPFDRRFVSTPTEVFIHKKAFKSHGMVSSG